MQHRVFFVLRFTTAVCAEVSGKTEHIPNTAVCTEVCEEAVEWERSNLCTQLSLFGVWAGFLSAVSFPQEGSPAFFFVPTKSQYAEFSVVLHDDTTAING